MPPVVLGVAFLVDFASLRRLLAHLGFAAQQPEPLAHFRLTRLPERTLPLWRRKAISYTVMPYAIRIGLAIVTALLCRIAGFDRDRAIYPVILIVIAWYYVLFGVLGGSGRALVLEVVVMIVFTLVAVLGFSFNLWWVAAAMAGHGVFDLLHDRLITNPGVPAWWPAFCMAIDVGLAAWLAWLLLRGRIRAAGSRSEPQPVS